MRLKWMNTLRCLLAICFLSGLVSCDILANCLNNGFVAAACGGGSGESDVFSLPQPTATSAEGRWTGTTPTNRAVDGLVLDDGSYWVLYTAIDKPNVLAGLVQGTGTSHSGSFGSSNTRDFNLEDGGIRAATMRGIYGQKKGFNATITYFNGDTGSFTSTYDADYELIPNMNHVAGTYSGLRADNQMVSVTLGSIGTVSGSFTDGCTFAGSFAPRAKGNVFNVTVTFGGGACSNGTDTVSGIAFFDAATQRLYSAALNSARTNGFLFIGMKL